MKPGEHGILRMQIGHGCVGPHAYTLAYGLLRRPGDTVIAHVGGTAVRLKRTVVAAYLSAGAIDGDAAWAYLPPARPVDPEAAERRRAAQLALHRRACCAVHASVGPAIPALGGWRS